MQHNLIVESNPDALKIEDYKVYGRKWVEKVKKNNQVTRLKMYSRSHLARR